MSNRKNGWLQWVTGGRTKKETPQQLREIANEFIENWPDWSDTYHGWKPDSLLPAPKEVVKKAMKQAYAEWPDPIDWTVFSSFAMEFVDIATFIDQVEVDFLESLKGRKGSSSLKDSDKDSDLFLTVRPIPMLQWRKSTADRESEIERIRDTFLVQSRFYDLSYLTAAECSRAREIVLSMLVESGGLSREWALFCTSIGRTSYVK
jgi:hypothetical protein